MIAAMSVGLARAAMDAAVQYAKERITFGTPIGHHQAVQLLIADMAKDIEAARLLTWQCAWLIDQGHRATKESSLAKCFSTDVAMRVTTDAVQVFGGYGYMKDLPLEKYMRDAKLMQTTRAPIKSNASSSPVICWGSPSSFPGMVYLPPGSLAVALYEPLLQ